MLYTPPINPIAAATHNNPYPYYADLVAHQPIFYDDVLKMWVVTSVEAVRAVLASPLVRVRPTAEPIPTALLDSPSADIFRHLIRMNDDTGHCPFKHAVSSTLDTLTSSQIKDAANHCAWMLMVQLQPTTHPEQLTDFALQLPVYTVASLAGVPDERLAEVTSWMADFVRGIAPASQTEHVEQGKQAARNLLNVFHALLSAQPKQATPNLLTALDHVARDVGCDDVQVIVANAIGLLMQSYEATAGLIGNTLLLLARRPAIHAQITGNWQFMPSLLHEVLRYDAPVQNTRRFVAEAGMIAGQAMQAGDAILVVLAAANHDPAANPNPQQFDLFRQHRQSFTFGVGVHACPGDMLATSIAQAALEQLLTANLDFARLDTNISYRPSANTRIPVWQF